MSPKDFAAKVAEQMAKLDPLDNVYIADGRLLIFCNDLTIRVIEIEE